MRPLLRWKIALVLVLLPTVAHSASAADELTPASLGQQLAKLSRGEDPNKLAESIRSWFGRRGLEQGGNPKIEGLEVAWAIEAPGAARPPRVTALDGSFDQAMTQVGDTGVYALTASFPSGTAFRWAYQVDGKMLLRPGNRGPASPGQLEVYSIDPDTQEHPGVPKGKLARQSKWKSKIFEGTSRDWWVYVPAQYDGKAPACVMVFQDGSGYKDFVPAVFDNLIAQQSMPVTVGVFINPGGFDDGRSNRSFEYDTLSDQYARFLLEEILPEVEKNVKLRHDPEGRAIAGISSGGICAFTVAWERPDEFSKVLSWVGSFTNIASGRTNREGGHNYEALIRKSPKRPIRVFLQDGANDLDNRNGNWPLANQQMAKSLAFSGYDYQFVFGNGFHSNRHGRAILPESLRWLWRDEVGTASEGTKK